METYKPAGERLADLLAEDKELNKKVDDSVKYFKEEKEELENTRTLVFTWVGLAKDWKLYSEHLFPDFLEHDEDVRSKLWAK